MLTDEEKSNWWNATPWNADLKTRIFAYAEFIERAVIAAYEAKLRKQEPVAVVVDSDSLESVISPALAVGTELFTHPAPIPEDAIRYQFLRDNPDFQIEYTGNLTLDEHVDIGMAAARSEKCCQ